MSLDLSSVSLLVYIHSIFSTLTLIFFFFNDTATTEIYTLSLHDALPIFQVGRLTHRRYGIRFAALGERRPGSGSLLLDRSEEHTSELQSLRHLVCRLLLEKKKKNHCMSAR